VAFHVLLKINRNKGVLLSENAAGDFSTYYHVVYVVANFLGDSRLDYF